MLRTLPPSIALNKWTKYQKPAKYVDMCIGFHNILGRAFDVMNDGTTGDGDDAEKTGAAEIPDLDMGSFRTLKGPRINHASKFLNNEGSLKRLLLVLLALSPLNFLAARFFNDSKDDFTQLRDGYLGPLLDLASSSYSPALRALDAYSKLLIDDPLPKPQV